MENDNITITLRPFNVSDAEDFLLLASSDDSVIRSFNLKSKDVDVIISFFKNKIIGQPGFKAICLNNKPIGARLVSTYTGDSSRYRAAVGDAVHSSYWGKGIATRAVQMVANTIVDKWPHLERLEAFSEVDNLASQRVLLKAGFKKEGVLRKYSVIQGKLPTLSSLVFSLQTLRGRSRSGAAAVELVAAAGSLETREKALS